MNPAELPKTPNELLIAAAGFVLQALFIWFSHWLRNRPSTGALPAPQAVDPERSKPSRLTQHGPTAMMLLLAAGTVSAWTAAASKGQIGQLVQRARGSVPMEANSVPLLAPPVPEDITPVSACPDCPASCSCNESSKNCKCPTRESELAGRPSSVLRSLPWFNEPVNAWAGRYP